MDWDNSKWEVTGRNTGKITVYRFEDIDGKGPFTGRGRHVVWESDLCNCDKCRGLPLGARHEGPVEDGITAGRPPAPMYFAFTRDGLREVVCPNTLEALKPFSKLKEIVLSDAVIGKTHVQVGFHRDDILRKRSIPNAEVLLD